MITLSFSQAKTSVSTDSTIATTHITPGLAYSRAAGVATGLFLLVWGPLTLWRWPHYGMPPLLVFSSILIAMWGLALVLPWQWIQTTRWWKLLYTMLIVLGIGFAFNCVADMMFQYMLAADLGKKPGPPAFLSVLLFISLLQIPTVYFLRYPQHME